MDAPSIEPAAETIDDSSSDAGASDDSGYDDIPSMTTSLASGIYDYKYEHGRRFHAYKEGQYFMPNDEPEQDRMDLQHRAVILAFENKYFHCPLSNPQRVLDLGTGTGIWAMEFADQHPSAEVVGVDLSPIQPKWVPPNVKFEIDDIEEDWTWPPDHFDYVHDRFMLAGSIADFPKLFKQAYKHLKPGGFFEIQEMNTDINSDTYTFPPDSNLKLWCSLMREGITHMHRTLGLDFGAIEQLMRDVGFVDVVAVHVKVPIGQWPAEPRLKEVGGLQLLAMLEGLDSLSLAIFTRCLGWLHEEVEVLLAKVRREFRNRGAHLWWPAVTIYGRKPLENSS